MKNQPLDSLTKQDRYNIRKYIYLFNNCKCGPLDIVLGEWNYAKRRLYHAFGEKLSIERTITIEKNINKIYQLLKEVYFYTNIKYERDFAYLQYENKHNIPFYKDFAIFVKELRNLSFQEKKNILSLFKYNYIINGYVDNLSFKLNNYSFSVRNGCKTIRTIQKCLKSLKYPRMNLFKDWVNAINNVNLNQIEKATLVLSINPIDFMTMSDNDCNWSSCMSWINKGCYNAGTIEMMNSNVAVVAYLKSKKDFLITLDENNILNIPNKSWRILLYCHKNILLSGKSYPYENEALTQAALSFLKEIVTKSFGWTYRWGPQLYNDISHYYKNAFLKYDCNPTYNQSNKIIVYTNGMYNDLIEDTSINYWCYRNKTNGIRICLSGKLTCLCCGKELQDHTYLSAPEDIQSEKICFNCLKQKCPICGKIKYNIDNKYNLCSEECKKDAIVFPGQNRIISKTEFLSNSDISFFICGKSMSVADKIYDILRINNVKDIKIKSVESFFLKYNLIKGRDYIIRRIPQVLIKEKIIIMTDYISKIGIYDKYFCKNNFYIYSYVNFRYKKNSIIDGLLDKIKSLKDFYYYTEKKGGSVENSIALI